MSIPTLPPTTTTTSPQPGIVQVPSSEQFPVSKSSSAGQHMAQPERRQLFGVEIDPLTMTQAVEHLWQWTSSPAPSDGCRFVVTPNVDHTVLLQENAGLRAAYADAHLVLADGHPVVWASKLLGQPVPERVAGSELVPQLFNLSNQRGALKVFLLGAAEGVAEVAAKNMLDQWPNVDTVGTYSPPMGFEKDDRECAKILSLIEAAKPDVLVVGLGAPKQELWVHRHYKLINAKVALCVGATIDFLAGEKQRAPYWMQRAGIEWAHRMCSEPKRLVKRYAKDAWIFPQLVARQWLSNARHSVAQQNAQQTQRETDQLNEAAE